MNVINFNHKACEKIRGYLEFYINNELLTETNHEVLTHLESCRDCAAVLANRLRVKRMLQGAMEREAVPAGLEARVQRSLRRGEVTRRQPQNWRPWALAFAATLTLVLGGWSAIKWWTNQTVTPREVARVAQPAAFLQVGLEDHTHCAVEAEYKDEVFTLEQMTEEMGPQYVGLVPRLEEGAPQQYTVTMGHKCHIRGREFVHLILRHEEKYFSVIITRKSGEQMPAAELATILGQTGIPLYAARLENWSVAGFESREHLAFIVSDLPQEENRQLAAILAPVVQNFLNEVRS